MRRSDAQCYLPPDDFSQRNTHIRRGIGVAGCLWGVLVSGGGRKRFSRFIVVGVTNTVVGYATFHLALALLPESPVKAAISNVFAYAVGMTLSYALNRLWTFGSSAHPVSEGARFVLSQLFMLAFTSCYLWLAVDIAGWHPSLNWFFIAGVAAVINYTLLNRFVFAAGKSSSYKKA